MSEPTCALWWYYNGTLQVELCETEAEAVEDAIGFGEGDNGSPAGVQFSDGQFVWMADWEAYRDEKQRLHEELVNEALSKPSEPTPRQEVTPPFEDHMGRTATVRGKVPSWLGAQVKE